MTQQQQDIKVNEEIYLKSKHFQLKGKRLEGAQYPSKGNFVIREGNTSLFIDTGFKGQKNLRVPFGPMEFSGFIEALRMVGNDELPEAQLVISTGKPQEPIVVANILISKSENGNVGMTFQSKDLPQPLYFSVPRPPHLKLVSKTGDRVNPKLEGKYFTSLYVNELDRTARVVIGATYKPYKPPMNGQGGYGGNKGGYGGGQQGGYNNGGQQGGGYGGGPAGGASLEELHM